METNENKTLYRISSTDSCNSKVEFKVIRAQSYPQLEAEGELRMFVKKKVIETWDKLIY